MNTWIPLFFLSAWLAVASASPKIDFWNTPHKGTNFFNEEETKERFQAARAAGLDLVRLTFSKWKSSQNGAVAGDFILGPAHKYEGINSADVARLMEVLDWAREAHISVVITTLSLPGARWFQQNNTKPDHRLWQDFKFHRESEQFWRALASELKNHPAVVGYSLLNEPHPEKAPPGFHDWYLGDYNAWYASVRNTPRDLNLFYEGVIKAIREVDAETPIVLDSGYYANPHAFKVLRASKDEKVIYSFHMYEPYAFTNHENRGKYKYPGQIPIGENNTASLFWGASELDHFLDPVRLWCKANAVPENRIWASEFGVFRTNAGGAQYLEDLLNIFEKSRWHWSFYSYQEDTWAGMDYELGENELPASQKYPLVKRKKYYRPNPLWQAIQNKL